jgi:RHS repeat-associated protein
VEFLELGVNYGSTTEWKLYGPDLHGVYGGMNGVGGLDAVSPILNLFQPTVSDFRGNILGVITNGMMFWNPARPTGYGAVPGYQPLPLANGANIALASAWRGRWADITGLYNIGLRPYEATSGRWLTFDSVWNEIDPNGMSFCGGDPINSMDSDGRLSAQSALNTLGQDNSTKNLYFGIAPVMQTYIQTIYGINGLSVPTGMPGEPDSVLTNPGDITGQSQRLWTIPTGQYFSYVSQTPLPDNWGQTTASWINSSGPDLMDIQLKEAGSYFKLLGAGAAVASGAEELLPELLGAEASVAAEGEVGAGQTLYRGVWDDHPAFQEALEGSADPRGGSATALEHNMGDTRSIYTSWTTDPALAAERAGPGGVVLQQTFPAFRLVTSPDLFGEGEVLVTGPVRGASVTPIP